MPHYVPSGSIAYRYNDQVVYYLMIPLLFVAWHYWQAWAPHFELPEAEVPGWLLVALAWAAGTMVHLVGHLLAGWSSDMALRGFRIGPIAGHARLRAEQIHWQFRFVPMGLLGGGSLNMVPKHLKRIQGRLAMTMFGGPLASLLVGSAALPLALSAYRLPWEPIWGFLALLGTFGLADFVANLSPLRRDIEYADCTQIYQIMSKGPWAQRHLARAMVGVSQVTPVRPLEFDESIVEQAATSIRDGLDGFNLRLFLAIHHLGAGRNEEAVAAWREAVDLDPAALETLTTESMSELVFFEAVIDGDLGRARQWSRWVEAKGDSRKEVDYWKGRSAILLLEGRMEEAYSAYRRADEFSRNISASSEYDRWCMWMLRQKLNAGDVHRLSQSLGQDSVGAGSGQGNAVLEDLVGLRLFS
jgi:tetratricopeptide (TPR) repeat protein